MTYRGQGLACKRLKRGNIEYRPFSPRHIAWLNLNSIMDTSGATSHKVKRIIRHRYSYRNGGYDSFGGYDISLVELEHRTTRATPACLPGPRFKDTVVSAMSGYGRYLRDNGQTCQTDGNGPMKYHYCAKRGGGDEVCHGGRPPRTKECRK